MYATAELFSLAADKNTSREVFLSIVTLSIPDDADGCVDLDAEKRRLSQIWDVAHMTMKEIVAASGMTQSAFAKCAGVPLRTLQGWCGETRECPSYLRFLLAEHYKLI